MAISLQSVELETVRKEAKSECRTLWNNLPGCDALNGFCYYIDASKLSIRQCQFVSDFSFMFVKLLLIYLNCNWMVAQCRPHGYMTILSETLKCIHVQSAFTSNNDILRSPWILTSASLASGPCSNQSTRWSSLFSLHSLGFLLF